VGTAAAIPTVITVSAERATQTTLVILNVTEGGVKDLQYLPFNIGA
jgi:hypothetical protein